MIDRRVALVTCAELGGLHPDDQLLVAPLAALDVTAEAVVWDDPDVEWSAYDVAVLRSTWDYPRRRDAFLAWARRVPNLANPADVVAWNTDKRYLAELVAAGVPAVPTTWVRPGGDWSPPDGGDWVVKPSIGAGSLDAARYDLSDPEQRSRAQTHVRGLTAAGRAVMVQPYLSAVDTYGETSVLFIAGAYSHAARKGPMLSGPQEAIDGLYKPEEISARAATPAELAVASAALDVVPDGAGRLLYARVDLIPGPDGEPRLVELELTEPSLFLGMSPGAAERLAAAIAASLPA